MPNYKEITDNILINFINKHLSKGIKTFLGIKIPKVGKNRGKYLIVENNYPNLVGLLLYCRDEWEDFDNSNVLVQYNP